MDAHRKCKNQQIAWANDRGLSLQGSKGPRGEPAYTMTLDENLFVPLSVDSRREFESGDGDELRADEYPCKMQAVHSSASIVVNVIEYWRQKNDFRWLTEVLGFPCDSIREMKFEVKMPAIHTRGNSPNLDVAFFANECSVKVIGVESKFTELYRTSQRKQPAFAAAYFEPTNNAVWSDLPRCRKLAQEINAGEVSFTYLDAAQLIKHLLGLRRLAGYDNSALQLNYLWFDSLCSQATAHRQELEIFADIVSMDDISFHHSTYQELIGSVDLLDSDHDEYRKYLVSRYEMNAVSQPLPEISRGDWHVEDARLKWFQSVPSAVRVLVIYEIMAQSVELLMNKGDLAESFGSLCRAFLDGKQVDSSTVVELANQAKLSAQTAMEHEVLSVDICTAQVLCHATSTLAATVVCRSARDRHEFQLSEEDAMEAANLFVEWMFNFAESTFELPEATGQSHELLEDEIDAQFAIITTLINFTRTRNLDWREQPEKSYRVWRDTHPDDCPI